MYCNFLTGINRILYFLSIYNFSGVLSLEKKMNAMFYMTKCF
jgi:hypothetical protein